METDIHVKCYRHGAKHANSHLKLSQEGLLGPLWSYNHRQYVLSIPFTPEMYFVLCCSW